MRIRKQIVVLSLPIVVACSDTSASAPVDDGDDSFTPGGMLGDRRILPPDDPWNTSIADAPVDVNSDALIASCGANAGLHPDFGTVWDGAPNGIPFVVVDGNQSRVPVAFDYADESDPGPYPLPPDAPIEGGASGSGDRRPPQGKCRHFRLPGGGAGDPVGAQDVRHVPRR